MTSTNRKPLEIRAPSWMDRRCKHQFRSILRQVSDGQTPVSDAKLDLIADLADVRCRLVVLRALAAKENGYCTSARAITSKIVAINRQVDATLLLAHRLADRLGLNI